MFSLSLMYLSYDPSPHLRTSFHIIVQFFLELIAPSVQFIVEFLRQCHFGIGTGGRRLNCLGSFRPLFFLHLASFLPLSL